MDNHRVTDADDESNESWASSELIDRIALDLIETFVRPVDRTTESKHLEAILMACATRPHSALPARAIKPAEVTPNTPTQTVVNFARPAEPKKAAGHPARGGLASPFAARTSGAGNGHSVTTSAPPATGRLVESAQAAGTSKWRQHHVFLGSLATRAAAIVAVAAVGASGLAMAGALPRPVQTAFSQAGDVIGLDIPAPIVVPEIAAPPSEQTTRVPVPRVPEPELIPQPASTAPEPDFAAPLTQHPPVAQTPPVPAAQQDWLAALIRQAMEAAANENASANETPPAPGSTQQSSGYGSWEQYWSNYGGSSEAGSAGRNARSTGTSHRSQPPTGGQSTSFK